ncbi:MAG: hypothetical protein IPM28_04425 [Chloracidobacterium sp.]|nr:hypothetical protein [Chloracidobacterium sp.]
MEFSLPFGNYQGRNGNSTPFVLNYSSKVWESEMFNFRREIYSVPANGVYNYEELQSYDITFEFARKTIAGWTSSLQSVAIILEEETYDQYGDKYRQGLTQVVEESCQDPVFEDWICEVYSVWIAEIGTEVCSSGRAFFISWLCFNPHTEQPEFLYVDHSCMPSPVPTPEPTPEPTPWPTPTPTPPLPEPPPHIPDVPHLVGRLRLQMPNGSTVEFRHSDEVCDLSGNSGQCDWATSNTYLAVDGSGMRFQKNEIQPNNETRSVLYFPNGSKYLFPVGGTPPGQYYETANIVVDRNGNKSTYDNSNNTWTDTLGRTVRDPLYNPLNLERPVSGVQSFDLTGIDGSQVSYSLVWKRLQDAFEDPLNSQIKYLGEDKCTWLQNSPVSGTFLFQNQEMGPLDDQILNGVRYIRRQRGCASMFGGENPPLFNPVVLSEIIMADGSKYEFLYNEYAEITLIRHPTGAYEKFEYGKVRAIGVTALEVYTQTNRGVLRHIISEDGTANSEIEYLYREIDTSLGSAHAVFNPDGSKTERVLYESAGSSFGFEDPRNGMAKEERTRDANGHLISRRLNDWEVLGPQGPNAYQHAARDPRVKRNVTIVFEAGSNSALATMTVNEFDDAGSSDPEHFSHLNVKRTINYHYKVLNKADIDDEQLSWATIESENWFSNVPIASITETDYSYDPDYKARGITSRPVETRVLNPANPNDVLAKTQFVYDEAAYFDNNYTTTNWVDPNSTLRGNVTTTRTWNKDTDTWLESHTMYDNFGNVRKVWDASGTRRSSPRPSTIRSTNTPIRRR